MDVNVSELIQQAKDEKASDFQTTFNNLMLDKVAAAIEAKRQEVAKAFFAPEQEEQDEPEEVDNNEDAETTT